MRVACQRIDGWSGVVTGELAVFGEDVNVSSSWSKRFLRSLSVSCKHQHFKRKSSATTELREELRVNLQCKLCWTAENHSIPEERWVNAGQTAVRLCRPYDHGWTTIGESSHAIGGEKIQLTCFLDSQPRCRSQVINRSEAFESQPNVLPPITDVVLPLSLNHWSKVPTKLQFLRRLPRPSRALFRLRPSAHQRGIPHGGVHEIAGGDSDERSQPENISKLMQKRVRACTTRASMRTGKQQVQPHARTLPDIHVIRGR